MQVQKKNGYGSAESKKLGKDKLERVIGMMKGVESHMVDPFLLSVDEIIHIVQEYFPGWDQPEELNLDAEAIHHLASVIKLQSEWVKQRSTSLYTNPFLLEEKIVKKNKAEMMEIFLRAWHPIVEQEQITLRSMADALRYWNGLAPIKERWEKFGISEIGMGVASRDELVGESILRDEAFSAELERYWGELKARVDVKGEDGKLFYMDWVVADTYEETVHRAYITSFLVTYGYATLELVPLEELVFILPLAEPSAKLSNLAVSVPISLSFESWEKWRRGDRS